jgi:hypothetical protein
MDADIVYSILISSTWCFLGGWVLLLSLTSAMVFRHDLPPDMPEEAPQNAMDSNLTIPCRGNT